MKKYALNIGIIILVLFTSNILFSQKIIEIKYEKDKTGTGYVFECRNNSFVNYTVTIDFSTLVNLSADVPMPYKTTVSPGNNRLFKLSMTNTGGGTNFNYSISYQKGCEKTKVDTSFAYLLPISPSKSTKVFELFNIGEKYAQKSPPKDWYALGFKVEEGDTVFAARKGIVGEVVSDQLVAGESLSFSREVNYVEIQHEDCTFAKYELFKQNGVFVKVGETVQAGQPLGIISSKNFSSGSHMRLSVYYSFVENVLKAGKKTEDKYYQAYVPIRFWVEGSIQKLEKNKSYTSEHPEVLIIKEMSKKEKKKRNELGIKN